MSRRAPLVTSLLALSAIAAALGAVSSPARAEDRVAIRLETLVPSRTLAFASLDDIGSWKGRWKKTSLSRLLEEPEMKAFTKPIEEDVEKLLKGEGKDKDTVLPPVARRAFEQVQGLSGQAAVALVSIEERRPPVMAANLDFGEHLRDFVTFLKRMKEEKGEDIPLETTERDGRTWWTFGRPEKPDFVGSTIGTSVLVSTDKAWVDAVIASEGAAVKDSLADVDAFKRARSTAGDGTALFVFGNAPALVDRFVKEMRPDDRRVADTLGLDTVRGVTYAFGFRGDVFRETLAVDGKDADHGILPLLKAGAVSRKSLPLVPSTAFAYSDGSFPLSTILPKVREMVAKIDPEVEQDIEKALADAKSATGVDIEKDLLAALGDELGYYFAMPETGGLYPELAVMLAVKDPASFEALAEKAVNGLLETIGKSERIIATQRTVEWHGKRLHVVDLSSARSGVVPFTPTWTLLGDRWVVTLVPHAMKELILRSEAGGKGLAGEEDFASILRAAPEGATSIGYLDTQALLTLLYDTGVPLLQTLLKENALRKSPVKFDPVLLPATRTVRPYLRSVGIHGRVDGQQLVMSVDSPFGYLLPTIGLSSAAVFLFTTQRHAMARSSRMASMAEDEANIMVADLQVRSLVDAVRKYQSARGALPKSLGSLLQETDADTGRPFLDRVPTDPWHQAYEYQVKDARSGDFVVVSAGPDRSFGTADDIVHPTPTEK